MRWLDGRGSWKEDVNMTPREMGERADIIAVGITGILAAALILINKGSHVDEELLNLDGVSKRQGKYEPHIDYKDGNIVVARSLFSRDDMKDYIDEELLSQLPTLGAEEYVGVNWLEDSSSGRPECTLLMLHYISTDDYYLLAKTVEGDVEIANLDNDPTIRSQLDEGGEILDVSVMSDKTFRVLYKGNSRSQDTVMLDQYNNFAVVR